MNATPVYTLQIPSTKKDFKFRPFLVKDEKALLIAQQSEDPTVMLDTVKEVIQACAKSKVDVATLAAFDVEYMFMQIRARSVGEIAQLVFACDVDHGEDNEKARSTVSINLLDIKVEFQDDHAAKIPLFGECGIVMKYPTIGTIRRLETSDENDLDQVFDIIVDCIDYIYDAEEVFQSKEQSKQELMEFLNNLTSDQFDKIQKFFYTMPSLKAYVKYTCPVCGKDHNKYLEGLQSFF